MKKAILYTLIISIAIAGIIICLGTIDYGYRLRVVDSIDLDYEPYSIQCFSNNRCVLTAYEKFVIIEVDGERIAPPRFIDHDGDRMSVLFPLRASPSLDRYLYCFQNKIVIFNESGIEQTLPWEHAAADWYDDQSLVAMIDGQAYLVSLPDPDNRIPFEELNAVLPKMFAVDPGRCQDVRVEDGAVVALRGFDAAALWDLDNHTLLVREFPDRVCLNEPPFGVRKDEVLWVIGPVFRTALMDWRTWDQQSMPHQFWRAWHAKFLGEEAIYGLDMPSWLFGVQGYRVVFNIFTRDSRYCIRNVELPQALDSAVVNNGHGMLFVGERRVDLCRFERSNLLTVCWEWVSMTFLQGLAAVE
ncbi:MAG: hypothetical protein P9M14_13465 [Candidatus Alcyoniella australis]|nr:hypothetical protein [Candidatus Alcyoniella australis]